MSDSEPPQTVLEKRAAAQKWREQKAEQYRKALRSSVLGLEIVVFVLVGGAIGYYIDNNYGTAPWGFWVGGFFGDALNNFLVLCLLCPGQQKTKHRFLTPLPNGTRFSSGPH